MSHGPPGWSGWGGCDGWYLEAMCEQPAASRGWLIPFYLVFSALLWLTFGGGCRVSGVIPALLITSWQVCEGKPFNTAAGSGETHTYTHLLPWMCMFAQPPRFPYRIPDCNLSVRPGRKVSASIKLFIHQSPAHLCMYEYRFRLPYFIVLKFPLTSSHTSNSVRCLVQNCNNNESRQLIKALSYDSK